MKTHRFPTLAARSAGLSSTAGLVQVSLLVSFGYGQNRSADTTRADVTRALSSHWRQR